MIVSSDRIVTNWVQDFAANTLPVVANLRSEDIWQAIMCVLLLCVKDILKKSDLAKVPDLIYQMINASMALLMLVAVAYAWAVRSNYWECCQRNNKLNSSSKFIDLLKKLENI